MNSDKYFELEKLAEVVEEERKKGKTVALANGGFDLIHIGHIRYLRDASEVADVLIVALNSDSSLKTLKGDDRAIIDETGRVTIMSAFEFVDYVTVFSETTVDNVLLTLKPDFHCKGSDYTPETVPERHTVKSYGGKIAIVGGPKVQSTSTVVKSLREEIDQNNS